MEHPLEKFRFCPACGSSRFVENNFKSKRCGECGFVYYANPCSATAAFCDMGETVEEGMRREIKEETGLEVTDIRYLFSSPNVYMYSGMGVHTLDMDFLVPVHGTLPAVKADDDAAEARWIPVSEVNPADFGLKSIRNAVVRFLAMRQACKQDE